MTKTFKRIIITAIVLIALAGAACAVVLSGGCSSSVASSSGIVSPFDNIKNGLINAAVDVSGVKGKVDAELRSKAGELAEQIGVPQSVADGIVDSLAIEDWQVTSLPAGTTEEGTYAMDIGGIDMQVTTYDDPGFVSVNAFGQSAVMAVPDSAQSYLSYLQYLQFLQ